MFGSNSLKSLDKRLKAVEATSAQNVSRIDALDQRISRAIAAADTAKAGLDQLRADVRSMTGIEQVSARLDELARDFAEVRSRQIDVGNVLQALHARVTHIEGLEEADDADDVKGSPQGEATASADHASTAPLVTADAVGDPPVIETTGFVEVGSVLTIPPEDPRILPPQADERAA